MTRDRWWSAAEVVVILLLVVSWSAGFLSVDAELDAMTEFGRIATFSIYKTNPNVWIGYSLGLAGIASVAAWRFAPLPSFVGCAALTAAAGWWFTYVATESFALEAAVVIGAFATVRATGTWAVVAAIGAASVIVGNLRQYGINSQLEVFGTEMSGAVGPTNRILALLVLLALAVAAGQLVRRVLQQTELIAHQNDELIENRLASERNAVVTERIRSARDVHDVVANHVTAMTVHAGAARRVSAGQPQVEAALTSIETSGRSAVDELHRMLGFLRSDDESEPNPARRLQDLPDLVDSLLPRLDVDLHVLHADVAVPTGVEIAIYRIVQESLTNVLKHSQSPSAVVQVVLEPDRAAVEVSDSGPPNGPRAATTAGHGLAGVQERAVQLGGNSEAGPSATGGWTVRAALPYRADGLAR